MNEKREEINRYLTEKMGKCWHKWDDRFYRQCIKCGNYNEVYPNIDLFSEVGFFKLLGWAKKEEWWIDFLNYNLTQFIENETPVSGKLSKVELALLSLIDKETFPEVLYEWLKENANPQETRPIPEETETSW